MLCWPSVLGSVASLLSRRWASSRMVVNRRQFRQRGAAASDRCQLHCPARALSSGLTDPRDAAMFNPSDVFTALTVFQIAVDAMADR